MNQRRLHPWLFLVLGLVAGCAVAPPAELRDDPEVQKLASKRPKDGKQPASLAIAPVAAVYAASFDLEKDPGRMPAIVDRVKLSEALRADIAEWTAFAKPLLLPEAPPPGPGLRGAQADAAVLAGHFRRAAEAGADVLLVPRLKEFEVYFDKRNGAWIWNVMLWLYFWVPAWWVHDEDYGAKARLECAFYSVASERLLFKEDVVADEKRSLDDFDRGWDFLGVFRVPNSLDGEQMRRVNDFMTPYALRTLEKKVVLEVGEKLPAYMSGESTQKEYAAKGSTVYALLAGVAKYRDDAAISGPEGAPNDVADLGALLRDALGVPEKNIVALTNAQATGYRVEAALAEIGKRARPDDVILVYFSGCGTAGAGGADGGREAYLLPYDARTTELGKTGIAVRGLAEKLRAAPARRSVVLADAAFGPHRGGSRSLKGAAGPEAAPPAAVFEQASKPVGDKEVTLLVATGGGDPGSEDAMDFVEARRGLFTYLLVEGARGRADADASGDVSLEELAAYVGRHVKAQAGLEGVTQVPALYRAGTRVPVESATGGGSWLPIVKPGRS